LANTKSAIKRARQATAQRMRNRAVRSRLRTFVRRARASLAEGDKAAATDAVMAAVSEIDRAAQKGVIHRNKADRDKSRLMRHLNGLE
jgi:small subunit ribosomal protein S20